MENIENTLKKKYKPTKIFRGIDTEVVKQECGITLNNRKLNRIIIDTFEGVKVRGDGFNKKFFLETI